MLDVCLLGTGGMMPLPHRWLTSCMMKYNGSHLLIDCGEGTQIAIKEKGWTFKPIDVICITHYHADHISGLPGLLLTMGNAERTEPLTMIGPKGLERVVNALRTVAPELPFSIRFIELTENEQTIRIGDYRIEAFRVHHNVVCYGYSVSIDRIGRFMVEKAEAFGLPKQAWGLLQKGGTYEMDGMVYTTDMVVGPPRKGLKVTYCTDTRPVPRIAAHAKGSDLFICEGMYGEKEKTEKAKEHKHMTMQEAACIAREAGVHKVWLTHYSPSMMKPQQFIEDVRQIYPYVSCAKDGQSVDLCFEED